MVAFFARHEGQQIQKVRASVNRRVAYVSRHDGKAVESL
jgi:hypothetical protein